MIYAPFRSIICVLFCVFHCGAIQFRRFEQKQENDQVIQTLRDGNRKYEGNKLRIFFSHTLAEGNSETGSLSLQMNATIRMNTETFIRSDEYTASNSRDPQ